MGIFICAGAVVVPYVDVPTAVMQRGQGLPLVIVESNTESAVHIPIIASAKLKKKNI